MKWLKDTWGRWKRRLLTQAREELLLYLEKRALVLPTATRVKLANELGVSATVVEAVERALRERLLAALRQWLKVQ